MKQASTKLPAGSIKRININGLAGRVLEIPKTKRNACREILLIYGMHSSLERYYTVAQALADFGNVTMPDLPGHGGMDSFYKIKMVPSLDNLADYLASFIKLKYKNKRLVVIGMSLGFEVVTNLLARYPEIANQVDLVVSAVGFTHYDDFKIKKINQRALRFISWVGSRRLIAPVIHVVFFNQLAVKFGFAVWGRRHLKKYTGLTKEQVEEYAQIDINLWLINDLRTRGYTGNRIFNDDLTNFHIPLTVHHIYVPDDQYFHRDQIKLHMQMIYTGYKEYRADIESHGSTLIASKEEAAKLFPSELQKFMKSSSKRRAKRG